MIINIPDMSSKYIEVLETLLEQNFLNNTEVIPLTAIHNGNYELLATSNNTKNASGVTVANEALFATNIVKNA